METATALTNFTPLQEKIAGLFSLQKITRKDIEGFTKAEHELLSAAITEALHHLKGAERGDFIDKIEDVVSESANERFWEHNHYVIGKAITKMMNQYGAMPTKSAIAAECGLSRQTVAKHLAGYKTRPEYQAQMEQFKYLAPRMLAGVCSAADAGDVKGGH